MKGKLFALLATLAGFATSSLAQGPDVIVGDLPGVSNFGVVGATVAYSVGTTSCNQGDQPLTWIASTADHPVISQNMYRLVNGRFEQIGQAWLKHGFCALQGTVCGSCPNPLDCSALGMGCSDPYSSGLNGDQGGLGPKSEVNAFMGTFPYPWVNNGSGSGAIHKRMQVATADLQTAGSLYFVSSMYVQPEDAQAGNHYNNESYRRATVGAAPSYTLGLADTTRREDPAIFAWRDYGNGVGQPADASVNLTAVDIPNEGRFWVGGKATDLGAGQWHYEYAVMNFNSDRSGQSFSIPLPPGAVVTNVGFRDVPYHSGEPYSGTDWSSVVGANSITWQTQTHGANPNANALRWDTVYNFRFDCNIPPAGGIGSIGLFKPGTPTSVNFSSVTPSGDGSQHPLNDDCENALGVGDGAIAFSNVGATTDGPDEPTACNFFSYTNVGSDIWYLYTAECNGTVTVATCGSTFDTKIAVYNDTCPTVAAAVSCNDDNTICGASSVQSQLTFTAVANDSYLIRVGGYNALTGTGTLTITGPGCGPQPPINDACANAIWLPMGSAVTGTTLLSTNDGTANCGQSTTSGDVWYKYRPTAAGTVTVTTCGSVGSYDTVLSVHTGACGSLTQISGACNDDTCGLLSTTTFTAVAYNTYYIRVAGYQGATGNFSITVTGGAGVIPASNDDCAGRAGIGLGTTAFNTAGASTDGPTHTACNINGSNQITGDLWWNYPASQNGNLTISTCNAANFNTRIAAYSDSGCTNFDARILGCNDNGAGCGTTSSLVIPVVAGQNYTIRVGGLNARGTGTLTLSLDSSQPATITGDPVDAFVCEGGTTVFAVTATGSPAPTYEWRRNNVALINGNGFSGVSTDTLTINPVESGDAGFYTCFVSNSNGNDLSAAATLTVNTSAQITTEPAPSTTLCVGGTLNLSVTATGTAPMTFQWRRNGNPVSNGGGISGASTANLTINPVSAANAGTYTVLVNNICNADTSANALVTVNSAALITTEPAAATTICAGDPLNLSVAATGTGPISYLWSRNGNPLSNGGSISGATSANLSINPSSASDNGTYTVVAANACGNDTSANAVVTVNAAAQITVEPAASTTVCSGGVLNLSVTATGTLPITYEWRRGVTPLSNGGSVSGANTANLTINPVSGLDAGTYTCFVSNSCDDDTSAGAVVTVTNAPSITTGPSSQTVNNGAPVSFNVVAGGTAPLSYQWLLDGSPISDGGTISGSATDTLSISAAAEADEGDYSVTVTNSCGNLTSGVATLTVNPLPCPGDLNGDNQVNLTDLSQLLANFGVTSGATLSQGDLDGDGDVDLTDLSQLLSNFGASC
ncbi:MAG: immunoglobulin domain-containing protein [Phycisphaerae bacterium]